MLYVFDGAMGTMLHSAGLPNGYCPELWNIENQAAITAIHQTYVNHGAEIIETNSFGANRIKLSHYGLEDRVAEINAAAVSAAKKACKEQTLVAGSIGPTGKLLEPLGDLSFDTAVTVFQEQIRALDEAGADLLIIETIIDLQEMRAALIAAKSVSAKPVICQLSYGADGRSITGTDPETAAIVLDALGADVIGANCSLGPAQLLGIVERLAASCDKPISVQPNAGMPELIDGETIFPMSPDEMASWVPKLVAAGASYIGGCCGTTPSHIKAIKAALQNSTPQRRIRENLSGQVALTSRSRTVYLGSKQPTRIIGERINPTGRKALAAEIKSGSFLGVKREALGQIEAGADILDVNMGVPGIDQSAAMNKAFHELAMLTDAPLAIDTTDATALEAALKAYPGRALINSVSAEKERLRDFLPLAKKYGAAILCLPLSDDGVPKTAAERLTCARKIIAEAFAVGLKPQDIVLDALVLTTAADQSAALETLATLRLYRSELGYPSTMGLSNVSFGLPQRPIINAAFCAMAIEAGLDAPILNPYDERMKDTLAATAALRGDDACGQKYSLNYAPQAAATAVTPQTAISELSIIEQIKQSVKRGEREGVVLLVETALHQGHSSLEITDLALTAAMNEIGEAFGAGRCFLPQVLLSAETMRSAFQTIKQLLPGEKENHLGTVVLATVKGDIHDLGKNIVAALMENNGFKVIDLGKDVSIDCIVDAVRIHRPDILGLCALMTTTITQIDAVIDELQAAGLKTHTMVGGAVLTSEYAAQAGADSYASDGVTAVNIAKKIVGKKGV